MVPRFLPKNSDLLSNGEIKRDEMRQFWKKAQTHLIALYGVDVRQSGTPVSFSTRSGSYACKDLQAFVRNIKMLEMLSVDPVGFRLPWTSWALHFAFVVMSRAWLTRPLRGGSLSSSPLASR
jgi:hypothetical protein